MNESPAVKSIMTREVISIKPDTPLQEAAEVLMDVSRGFAWNEEF